MKITLQNIIITGILLLCFAIPAHSATRFNRTNRVPAIHQKNELADLVVQTIKLTAQAHNGEVIGRPAKIRIRVKNNGPGLSHKSLVRISCTIQNSRTRQCPKELTGILPLPALSPGKSIDLYWPVSARSAWIGGNYTAAVLVDHQNRIQETSENNNQKRFRFTVKAKEKKPLSVTTTPSPVTKTPSRSLASLSPQRKNHLLSDLVVTTIRLMPKPGAGDKIGKPAKLQIEIKNKGKGMAEACAVKIDCRRRNTSKILRCPNGLNGVLGLPRLTAGKTIRLSWPKSSQSVWKAGKYTISVFPDYHRKVPEVNEANNKKQYLFNITKPLKSGTPVSVDALKKNGKVSIAKKRTSFTALPGSKAIVAFDHEKECRHYAERAVNFSRLAEEMQCDFQGDRWIDNYDNHFSWCMSASHSQVSHEKEQRRQDIADCATCRNYAGETISLLVQARKNQCHFQGSGWSRNWKEHFSWCMGATPSQRKQEMANRRKDLLSCGEIKTFYNPSYMHFPLDFCMYRRPERYRAPLSDPGGSFDYSYGWSPNGPCGGMDVAQSYCISVGYQEAVDFKVADSISARDTMPLGNTYRCYAAREYANCRSFDYIKCRKSGPAMSKFGITRFQPKFEKDLSSAGEKHVSLPSHAINPPPMKKSVCRTYAEEAVSQYLNAGASGCPVEKGKGWSDNFQEHFDWCMAADSQQRKNESSARREQLQLCKTCRNYAATAVARYHEVNNRWCAVNGLSDLNWYGGDLDKHYQWCLTAGAAELKAMADLHKSFLDECRKTVKIYFPQPTYNGMRVSAFTDKDSSHYNYSPDKKKMAADIFCRFKGYSNAIADWDRFNHPLNEVVKVDRAIFLDSGEICDAKDHLCLDDECYTLDHIICEKKSSVHALLSPGVNCNLAPQQAASITTFCEAYAREAQQLVESAEKNLYCGGMSISPTYWNEDYAAVLEWCKSADPEEREKRRNARKRKFEQCKSCTHFARKAENLFNQALSGWCFADGNYDRSIWKPGKGGIEKLHHWCMAHSAAEYQDAIDEREQFVQDCQAKQRKIFYKPSVNGIRVDVCLNVSNCPLGDNRQASSDTYCISQGYSRAVSDWDYYLRNHMEEVQHSICLGTGKQCISSQPNAYCRGLEHIICEK